jgi:hypothetical protein
MVKVAQIVGTMNENFFDFFDLAVKKFCGSRIDPGKELSPLLYSGGVGWLWKFI